MEEPRFNEGLPDVATCRVCNQVLSINQFYSKSGKSKHKLRTRCRDCIRVARRQYYMREKHVTPFKLKAARARARAKLCGVPCDLDADYLKSIWTGVCPVFGIEISFSDEAVNTDNAADLDRFVPSKGYVRGNVNYLSRRANLLKNSLSTEELQALLAWMISQGDEDMATPEGAVKAKIKSWLKTLPDCWFYMPVQNGMGVVGIPDIICVIQGRMVAIETKAPGKEKNVTANQQASIDAINRAGGLAFVASDLVTAQAVLKDAGLC